jgi:rhodanese-related sulfurtransferase
VPARIDRSEVQRLVREEDAVLVEVLQPSDFGKLHLPAAINIPLDELDAASTGSLERVRPIVVYCFDYQ